MKAKLVIFFAAVLCMVTVITEASFAGANENASVQIKLLRESQVATWTSATQAADTLLNVAEGESFWVKVYALNVSDLFAWEINVTVSPDKLEYNPDASANYKIAASAAGETNLLFLRDESGLSESDIISVNTFYEDQGKIVLTWSLDNSSKSSNPALAADTGFVAEFRLTAKTGVTVGMSDMVKATKVLLTDVTGLTDAVAGLDTATVTFTPVELATFSSIVVGDKGVKLDWVTTSETNNYGFYVERSVDGELFETIDFVEGAGTTTEERSYSYVDNSVNSGTYYYRLKFVAIDGSITYSDVLEVSIGVPGTYELAQNYPNPFNPSTTIKFSLRDAGFVELKVYNVIGQLVETLVQRDMPAGYHSINFDASRLSSGIYFYSIKANSFSDIKKMVFVK